MSCELRIAGPGPGVGVALLLKLKRLFNLQADDQQVDIIYYDERAA